MCSARVRVLNSAFVVSPSREMYATFMGYLKRMYRFEFKRGGKRVKGQFVPENKRELKEKWVHEFPHINEYRLHISYLMEFRNYFKNYKIEYIIETPIMGGDVTIELVDWFEPRDEQPEWIEYLTTQAGPHLSLPATMGAGKTVTFLAVIAKYGKRACAILPPFLSDRWLKEINKFTKLTKYEFVYIAGGDVLKAYMTTLQEGRNPWKLVLFSIHTLRNYLRDYYSNPEEWIYSPEELFAKGDFGIKGVDEAHKELHFHFMMTMFFNVGRYVSLSGTLEKENEYLNNMAERLFPLDGRCPVPDAVATADASIYKMYFSGWIPKHKSPMGYSQIIFENQIRYHPSVCRGYFLYLAKILYTEFVDVRTKDTDKGLVFMATTKLADMFTEYLQTEPRIADAFKHLRIGRLRAMEPDSKCDTLDLTVTTVGRAGTGTDIPGILTLLNTIAISDGPLQRQVFGRGRKRDDVNCRYVRLYSPHIRKHVDYHLKSLSILKDLSTSVAIHELPGALPSPTPYDREHAAKLEAKERQAKKASKSKKRKGRKKKRR